MEMLMFSCFFKDLWIQIFMITTIETLSDIYKWSQTSITDITYCIYGSSFYKGMNIAITKTPCNATCNPTMRPPTSLPFLYNTLKVHWMNDSLFSLYSTGDKKLYCYTTFLNSIVEISSASSWPLRSSLEGRITIEFSSVFVPVDWKSGRRFNKTQTAETSVIHTTLCLPSVGTTAEDQ